MRQGEWSTRLPPVDGETYRVEGCGQAGTYDCDDEGCSTEGARKKDDDPTFVVLPVPTYKR